MIQSILRRWIWILLVSAIALLIFFCGNRVSSQEQWQSARAIAPPALLQQIVKENFQSGKFVDMDKMRVLKVERSRPLYLVDTRVVNTAEQPNGNPLCGNQKCLFLGYIPTAKDRYQRVLNLYLNPLLPPKITLLQPIQEEANSLPCLLIKQLEQKQIRATKLCFSQSTYEITESQLLPERYE